ncbi:MAG: hypothetical protein LC663_01995, partial [Actinobacteria bacterium]|nr:hypothetical protein [Actinomycetota bacterium]
MMNARARVPLFVLAAAFIVLPPTAARAEPSNVLITSIVQRSCGSLPCTPGKTIAPGSVVSGVIDIHVHAEDPVGLQFVGLEAQNPSLGGLDGSQFICVEQWNPSGGTTKLDAFRTWDTVRWT